jgi:hypothetical protein
MGWFREQQDLGKFAPELAPEFAPANFPKSGPM